MKRRESKSEGYISCTFLVDGDPTFIVQKTWRFTDLPVWKAATIEMHPGRLEVADLPAFREWLIEVEAEARRLDAEYPPGTRVGSRRDEATPADAA